MTQQDDPSGDVSESDTKRRGPAPVDTDGKNSHPAPRPGSNEAMNEERKTQPSRNRGVTDV